jgi:hypothetical protein
VSVPPSTTGGARCSGARAERAAASTAVRHTLNKDTPFATVTSDRNDWTSEGVSFNPEDAIKVYR